MSSSHPRPLITARHLVLAVALVLIVSLTGTLESQAHQLLSTDGTHASTPAPAVARSEDGISADDDVVLVLGYAAVVVLALGGLAFLDRKPPTDDHDHPLDD